MVAVAAGVTAGPTFWCRSGEHCSPCPVVSRAGPIDQTIGRTESVLKYLEIHWQQSTDDFPGQLSAIRHQPAPIAETRAACVAIRQIYTVRY